MHHVDSAAAVAVHDILFDDAGFAVIAMIGLAVIAVVEDDSVAVGAAGGIGVVVRDVVADDIVRTRGVIGRRGVVNRDARSAAAPSFGAIVDAVVFDIPVV